MLDRRFAQMFTLGFLFTVAACNGAGAQDDAAAAPAGDLPTIRLSPAFPQLSFMRPVWVGAAPGRADHLFVIEQTGRIVMFENRSDASETSVFLDIRQRVQMRHNEEGLLDLEFHPKFAENGEFYVWYSAGNPRRTVLSRFTLMKDDPNRADPDSEVVILEVEQPWGNHNGGTVLFGPDGYLYVSIGDGGAANDPYNHGQNLSTLLGTIIRIDVDNTSIRQQGNTSTTDGEKPARAYAIPADNPFVNREGARPEIWAYGLRNVWRMSFDKETGDLWAADVGQDKWEMVYLITKGGNYGWNITEGSHPFRPAREGEPADPILNPIVEYPRRMGMSITGGNVYRGEANVKLRGAYLYADYVSGRIWACRHEGGKLTAHRQVYSPPPPRFITSFGEDASRELYVCAFDRLDGREGKIYRVVEE